MTFEELYHKLLKESTETSDNPKILSEYDKKHIDCLLYPEKYAPVLRIGECDCSDEEQSNCLESCIFDAITLSDDGGIDIDKDRCTGCMNCIDHCKAEKLTASRDILPALNAVRTAKGPVYALIAPAFLGQFSNEVTPGKLRSAFKHIGFDGMLEVALFADILTLKEALEFDEKVVTDSDFQLTSCCCPLWIAMIRKIYHELIPHVPGAVSPMIASGRTIKHIHPDAITIFIGPCVAKKAEAREEDIKDGVDYVLTFQEIQDVFEFANINPAQFNESEKDHSSRAGRIYARTGGVSEAVKKTLERLNPNKEISIRTQQADGVPGCRALIKQIQKGETNANFFEGMGCRGGCVGGPKRIIDPKEGTKNVNEYGEDATYPTPIDNPYVIELLKRLGFKTVDSLVKQSDIFTRKF